MNLLFQLRDIVPTCYFGNSNFGPMIKASRMNSFDKITFFCWCSFTAAEKGLLILEDVTKTPPSAEGLTAFKVRFKIFKTVSSIGLAFFQNIDHRQVPSLDQAKLVFQSLAKIHGVFYQFLNGTRCDSV